MRPRACAFYLACNAKERRFVEQSRELLYATEFPATLACECGAFGRQRQECASGNGWCRERGGTSRL
jgi:hypothetical protein